MGKVSEIAGNTEVWPVKKIRGIRTEENEAFCNYFRIVQKEAEKQGCFYFADCGEGHELFMEQLEGENLSGWLIPIEKADVFEKFFLDNNVPDEWDEYWCCAEWSIEDGQVIIQFNDYEKVWMLW